MVWGRCGDANTAACLWHRPSCGGALSPGDLCRRGCHTPLSPHAACVSPSCCLPGGFQQDPPQLPLTQSSPGPLGPVGAPQSAQEPCRAAGTPCLSPRSREGPREHCRPAPHDGVPRAGPFPVSPISLGQTVPRSEQVTPWTLASVPRCVRECSTLSLKLKSPKTKQVTSRFLLPVLPLS